MLMKLDDIYHEFPPQQDEPAFTPFSVTGRNLAHGKRSVLERAFLGADLHLNCVGLVNPTVKQCSYLAGVCVPYVAAAVAVARDETVRSAVLTGELALLEAAKPVTHETLVEHFARSSAEEWLEVARVIGPSIIWDQMISPLV
jgi:hypothetical protein